MLPKGTYAEAPARSQPFVDVLYLALALIIMGVGFLKANISSIVGQLYPQGDPRRDPGFTLYYYGINLGAFWAAIICGLVGQTVELGRGFGLAGVGMLAGFLVFVLEQAAAGGPRRAARSGGAGAARGRADQSRVDASIWPRFAGVAVVWLLVRQYRADGLAAAGRLGRRRWPISASR